MSGSGPRTAIGRRGGVGDPGGLEGTVAGGESGGSAEGMYGEGEEL